MSSDVLRKVPVAPDRELAKVCKAERDNITVPTTSYISLSANFVRDSDDEEQATDIKKPVGPRRSVVKTPFRKQNDDEIPIFPHDVSSIVVRELIKMVNAEWVFSGTGGGGTSTYAGLQEAKTTISVYRSQTQLDLAKKNLMILIKEDLADRESLLSKQNPGFAERYEAMFPRPQPKLKKRKEHPEDDDPESEKENDSQPVKKKKESKEGKDNKTPKKESKEADKKMRKKDQHRS